MFLIINKDLIIRDEYSTLPAYTVMKWRDFESNPRPMMDLLGLDTSHERRHFSEAVLDMSPMKAETFLRSIKVSTEDDLQRLTGELLTKPILFHAEVQHSAQNDFGNWMFTWKEDLAILVNTRHMAIRDTLLHELSKAMTCMQNESDFCLKLDFGPSVRKWFKDSINRGNNLSCCYTKCNSDIQEMIIYITNTERPNECCMNPLNMYKKCPGYLACYCSVTALIWLPLWLLFGGPCYCVQRRRTVKDFGQVYSDVPVVSLL